MAYLPGEKTTGDDGAVSSTAVRTAFNEEFSTLPRNLVGGVASILGIAAGIALGIWIFHLPINSYESIAAFALAINLGLYAQAYHQSIVKSIKLGRFATSQLVATMASSFVLAALKALPFFHGTNY